MSSGPASNAFTTSADADATTSVSRPDWSSSHDINEEPPTSCSRAESLRRVWPFLPLLREFVAKRVSANDVEDVVQESLVRVWRREGAAPIDHPKSYLFTIASAVIVDRSRRERVRQRNMHCGLEERHHPSDPLSPPRILLGREQLMIFMRGFERLPSRTRDILLAIRMEGQCFKSVAKRFGISVSAVEKQVTNALRVLSEQLQEAERAKKSANANTPRATVIPRDATEQRQ
jgi:RNA polymerase sigma factor (sigma-70 family)